MLLGAGQDGSSKLGQGLGQELMLQEGEAMPYHSNTDSEAFLGPVKIGIMLCHLAYPCCISKEFSATSTLNYFSLLQTALCKLFLIKMSFSMCPQLIP